MDKYMEQLEYFFYSDTEIKKMLASIYPTDMDEYGEEAKIKYFDKLYKALENVNIRLGKFIQGPFFSENQFFDEIKIYPDNGELPHIEKIESRVPSAFRAKMDLLRKQLLKCESLNIPLRRTYNLCFANMSDSLIRDVKEQIYGDNREEHLKVEELITKSTTVNEILHVLHTHVENNLEIMESLPVIDKKEPTTIGDKGCILVGYPTNALAREIFERFEQPEESAYTYIVALKNRTMMMVRDSGHALTMQIFEDKNGSVKVDYFIPKITNVDEIANLPVNQQDIDYETGTASGFFIVPRSEAADKISVFTNLVPQDMQLIDMETMMEMNDINGDKEKAIQLIKQGKITPRYMLLKSKLAGLEVTPEWKKTLLNMAEEQDSNERKKSKPADNRENR